MERVFYFLRWRGCHVQSHYIEVAQGSVSSRVIHNWLWISSLFWAKKVNKRIYKRYFRQLFKGQIISKWFFGVFNFLQKTNKGIRLYYYETSSWLVFNHLLEEIEDTKKPFRNYLNFKKLPKISFIYSLFTFLAQNRLDIYNQLWITLLETLPCATSI